MEKESQKRTNRELKDPSNLPHYLDILDIEDKHFTNPSRTTEGLSLPTLPQQVVEMMNCLPTKYLVISGTVLKRNRSRHRELVEHKGLKPQRAKRVLKQALYQADEIEFGRNPTYRFLKSFKDQINKKEYNAVATVSPVSQVYADCMEVIDWFIYEKMKPKP
ncbi:MAG: hypothetical protein FWD02_01985 [Bacteroidales bacterium]|nr:hypothetical protein [Bacteroidales bacterium]